MQAQTADADRRASDIHDRLCRQETSDQDALSIFARSAAHRAEIALLGVIGPRHCRNRVDQRLGRDAATLRSVPFGAKSNRESNQSKACDAWSTVRPRSRAIVADAFGFRADGGQHTPKRQQTSPFDIFCSYGLGRMRSANSLTCACSSLNWDCISYFQTF